MVFVTASPVLTNEVKQYYSSLKQQLSNHLLVVKKVDQDEETKSHEETTDNTVNDDQQDKRKVNKETLDAEKEKLLKILQIKEEEIIQAEQIQQQLNLPEKISKLSAKHFPLFLTVQRLVYMLDASLHNSFFSRKRNGKIIGMESSLGWHNEDSGVFMINQDFKQSDELKRQLQEFELSIIAGDANNEDFSQKVGDSINDFKMDIITDFGQA